MRRKVGVRRKGGHFPLYDDLSSSYVKIAYMAKNRRDVLYSIVVPVDRHMKATEDIHVVVIFLAFS